MLQSLDTLGAGFQLASHDLDIRGAGNLLGEEQSGHIKEVGFELYQQMLEEAVLSLKAGVTALAPDRWSPQITMGTPVLIPDDYVADLWYGWRSTGGWPKSRTSARSTPLPPSGRPLRQAAGRGRHLLQVVTINALARRANFERVEAGPKGVVSPSATTSSQTRTDYPLYGEQGSGVRMQRPKNAKAQQLVFFEDWPRPVERLKGSAAILPTGDARRAGEGGLNPSSFEARAFRARTSG